MKLIKINTNHYIVVDNSLDFSETDYYWDDKQKEIRTGSNNHVTGGYKIKITHSTQPLYKNDFWAIQELKLSEIKELIGEADRDRKYTEENMSYLLNLLTYDDLAEDEKIESCIEYIKDLLQPKTEWEVEIINGKLKLK